MTVILHRTTQQPLAELPLQSLVGADLKGMALVGADFAGADLADADLSDAKLDGATSMKRDYAGRDSGMPVYLRPSFAGRTCAGQI